MGDRSRADAAPAGRKRLNDDSPQWITLLQQALQLEVDRGFIDLQGRRETFSAFLSRECLEHLNGVPEADQGPLKQLAEAFQRYPQLNQQQRQGQVRRCRQWLQLYRQRQRPQLPETPPRLRLSEPMPSAGSGPALKLALSTPLAQIRGIGPKTATRLMGLSLITAGDLLRYYPRDYLDYANLVRIDGLRTGITATVVATVLRVNAFNSPRNPNLSILELQLQDRTGRLRISRFFAGKRFGSPAYLNSQKRLYPPGCTVAVSGLVKESAYGPSFADPLIEVLESPYAPVKSRSIGRLLPVYGLTEGLGADRMRTAVEAVLPLADRLPDPLDDRLRHQSGLCTLAEALRGIHQPVSREDQRRARQRLVFDELLLLQLSLQQRRQQLRRLPAPVLQPSRNTSGLVQALLELLPFPLTSAQDRVLAEIRHDLEQPQPMARLVQGDVGSGKTVVALAALLSAIEAGHQGALMAPTEVLAEQHARKLGLWLPQLHVSTALLTGSTPAPRRRSLLQDLANGQLNLLIGTHALLEDPVQFHRLGLVVVDEQHRFGVRQRNRLLAKGLQPHLLTMTATPIPRTLALAVHGDLDVSQIDELPPGRQPIQTLLLRGSERQQAYDLIREQVALGQRGYVVLPLVDESDKLDLRSAITVHQQLQEEVFPELAVGLLHGRLSSAEKQDAILAFARGDTDVLVSTTVVEVGVDVPEASVMVIEHAERFGLAQLHQLRGRVGRGAASSTCLLINDSNNAQARQRLDVLVRSTDGFEIAEMDLRLRGPGQVLGTRQSGLPDLALASLSEDGDLLEQARDLARDLLEQDPDLSRHPGLKAGLNEQRQRQIEAARLN